MAMVADGLKAFLTDVKSLVQESINDRVDIDQHEIVKSHLICPLCQGYFYDATTIADCLHTFCKPCIVKHFSNIKNAKACPSCQNPTHGTNPFDSLRPDRQIQDILYAIVPEAFEAELKIEKAFWTKKGLPLPEKILNLTADVSYSQDQNQQEVDEDDLMGQSQDNNNNNNNYNNANHNFISSCNLGNSQSEIGGLNFEENSQFSSFLKRENSTGNGNLGDSYENQLGIVKPNNVYESIVQKYHNPFNYINLSDSHQYQHDQILKFKLTGKVNGLESNRVVKSSERMRVIEVKNLLCELYRRIVVDQQATEKMSSDNDSEIPHDKIRLSIRSSNKEHLHLPPHEDKKKKFPYFRIKNRSFDKTTTMAMLQNYQYCLTGEAALEIFFSFA